MPGSKLCPRCAQVHPLTSFGVRRNGKSQSWCKTCHSRYNASYYAISGNAERARARTTANKAAVMAEYRRTKEATPCADCGCFFPYYVTHYDHLDASSKLDNIATLANWGTRKRLLDEIAKCELVCANCHAERTHQRLTPPSTIGSCA